MLFFGSVSITDTEVWIEDRKYIQHGGTLYEIRNDAKGSKTKNKEDQRLFTETLAEIKRITSLCGPKEKKRVLKHAGCQTEECPRPIVDIPPTPPTPPPSSATPSFVSSFRPSLFSADVLSHLPESSLLRQLVFPAYRIPTFAYVSPQGLR
jgi:hypothetical protein